MQLQQQLQKSGGRRLTLLTVLTVRSVTPFIVHAFCHSMAHAPNQAYLHLGLCLLQVLVDVTAKAGLARASYIFNKQQVSVQDLKHQHSSPCSSNGWPAPSLLQQDAALCWVCRVC